MSKAIWSTSWFVIVSAAPPTSLAGVIVWFPVTANVSPSKVKLASPLIPPAPSAVVTRLLPSFAKDAPLANPARLDAVTVLITSELPAS